MTTGTAPKAQLLRGVLMLLVVFSGLCTIFASVVTVAEAWQEHAQARWPVVEARVDTCGLKQGSSGRRQNYYIRCRLNYVVGDEQNATNVYSSSVPSPEVWQYPPNQIGPFQEWVDNHPPGTPISVRYDPGNHKKVVLVADYMPRGGPRTPNNVKLLEVCAGSFLVLLVIARITRPRSVPQNGYSSMPLKP
ncbi:MAG TPA: DUF3592 domain-containing protein [Candidatus Dormibacteraeota bacterium]|jgi:hypothetical protein|nr:DUF3592 domain-containing protein [Candidatus Dormibacteraeota bacterium]